tara:strand:- start:68 stop:427 length:360 start_codon:yes stop_codon:yes gene_type:complete
MKCLLLPLLFILSPSVHARVVYITNFGRIHIEERCQDGKPDHQVWFMDGGGNITRLELKGQGNEYFKNPELIPSSIRKVENSYLCSQRQLSKKEIEAYELKVINACLKDKKEKGCKGWY